MKTFAWRRLARLVTALLVAGLTGLALWAPLATASVNATYSCTSTVLGQTRTYTTAVILSGTTPNTVRPGAAVHLTGFQARIRIPASEVAEAEHFGVTWIGGTITTFNVKATDATPQTINAAGAGIAIPRTTLPNPAAAVTITVPASPRTIGVWTAGAAGTMDFTTGRLAFSENDNLGVTIPVACAPRPAATIATTRVS